MKIDKNNKYCNSITKYKRLDTKEVFVGNIGIGGGNPIRIQSMTTVDTMNTKESVKQSIKMIQKGCEIVRLTAPSIREAQNLYNIKNALVQKGYDVPLVADIHFTPNAAIEAAKIVEKVRINPGNFSDKKKFQTYSFSKSQYQEELKRIEDKFTPFIDVCKEYKTAIRIGTNHGSLSDRILSQYGDTPMGMVESALEFVRICQKSNYHNIVLSMKASNTIVMMHAYRLLVNKMQKENMNYPIHLGVTEAGEGDDGRIKSAIGIGTLLLDGIGDTIRVSLTEPPEKEIPVAKKIIQYIDQKMYHQDIITCKENPINPFAYSRRFTNPILNIGGDYPPVVVADLSKTTRITTSSLLSLGYRYSKSLDKWHINERSCDYIFAGNNNLHFPIPGTLRVIYNYEKWSIHKKGYPLISAAKYLEGGSFSSTLNVVELCLSDVSNELLQKLKTDSTVVLLFDSSTTNNAIEHRRLFIELMNMQIHNPVFIKRDYLYSQKEKIQIDASIDIGSLLLDGLGDGVLLVASKIKNNYIINLVFDLLQGARRRVSKTEYISCPSCGRTLFDLEETTAKIRKKTSHLKGLKIGIMGCIVNGPGEMADADYGYVGTGPSKISLYKKKEMIEKNIHSSEALDKLIQLIKDNGDWIDP